MKWKGTVWLVVLVGLGGCAEPDCASACEDINECRSDEHCAESCEELEERSNTAGCNAELDRTVRCIDEADEQCDATEDGEECNDERGGLWTCLREYCDATDDARACDCIEGTTTCLVDTYPL
jgi:hypothetical protein